MVNDSVLRSLRRTGVSNRESSLKKILFRETATLLVLLFAGILLLPLAVYLVGQSVFGEYSGAGFSGFYTQLHHDIRDGHTVVWYLILSPYIIWQLLRLTVWGVKRSRA